MLTRTDTSPVVAQDLDQRQLLRFLTCGSVDDGKSTLIGRLLYECGAVPDDQIETLEADSRRSGTDEGNLDFALLLDGLSAEREQGITIDVAYRYFSTPNRAFIVADTPGHVQYTRNMATGASTADLAILLVDASKGLLQQTRRHARIASMLRIPHIVLAVNKMDLVDWEQSAFAEIVKEFMATAAALNFTSITAIPVNARSGENVVTRSDNTPWYDGDSLLSCLEGVEIEHHAPRHNEFAIPVQWVSRPNASFRGYAGTIAAGQVSVGDEVQIYPSGQTSTVAKIALAEQNLTSARSGQSVVVVLADEIDVSRGDIIGAPNSSGLNSVSQISASIFWASETPARAGQEYILKLGGSQTPARLQSVRSRIDLSSFEYVESETIEINGIGVATFQLQKPITVSEFSNIKELGSFILVERYNFDTVALGTIVSDVPAVAALSAETSEQAGIGARLRLLSERIAGVPGTKKRHEFWRRISWRLASSLFVATIAGAVSASYILALVAGLADFSLRPILRRWHRLLFSQLDPDIIHHDGSGI